MIGELALPQGWRSATSSGRNQALEAWLLPAAAEETFPRAIARPVPRPPSTIEPASEPAPAWPGADNIVPTEPPAAIEDARPASAIETPVPPSAAAPIDDRLADERIARRLPPSGKLVYQFYWGESRWLAGLATHQWVIENGHYTLSSNVSTTGLFGLIHPLRLVETSQGSVVGERLRPQMFTTQLNDYAPAIAYFNWDKGHFRWYRGKASFTQALPANAYDKISFLYQLYIAAEQESFLAPDITMGRGLEHFDIRNLGAEDVEIEGAAYPAIHLKRATTSADMEQVEIWLSTRDNLPLKMIYSNPAGDYFEQLIAAESIPVTASDGHQ